MFVWKHEMKKEAEFGPFLKKLRNGAITRVTLVAISPQLVTHRYIL